jgi:hypothetical protein
MRSCGSGAPRGHLTNDFLMNFSSRIFCLLCVLCASVVSGFSLDREAFTITNYDLKVQLEPEQQRLGVRGKITLRNDSSTSRKIVVLQISSSLDWRAITMNGKALQFVLQPYTSDIDHTGALSEAIITLPQEIAPHGTVDLDIGYEGVIPLDATRLTRIGTPEDVAKSSDWDQISSNFTAVRGAGYVAWYPIATESANLSDGESFFEVLGRWKQREAGSSTHLVVDLYRGSGYVPQILLSGRLCTLTLHEQMGLSQHVEAGCASQTFRLNTPTLLVADDKVVEKPASEVFYLPGDDGLATSYASQVENLTPLITNWFGRLPGKLLIADLPNPDAASFGSGSLLLTPLGSPGAERSGLSVAYQLAHVAFWSVRPWIDEGLAHFAQALYLEQEKGRQVALDYMAAHRGGLVQIESAAAESQSRDPSSRSLVNTANEELYDSKAMSVWWMLREMIGDAALKKAISLYRPEEDHAPAYMPKLIQAQTQRDLSWFFDDWIYHDRGLPDFKVESAFPAKTTNGTFMVTITVDNLGSAGAEVPVTVKFSGGEISKRLEVHAKNRATIRVETAAAPQEIVLNNGSVPERDVTNNNFSLETQSR